MSNTIITNYTDLNGPTSKVDNSLVVIVNKDGTISVDKETLNNLVKDQARTTGISVVRVGEDGRPDDASDYSSDDDNIPHVNLTVDSYYTDQDALDGQYECPDGLLSTLSVETRGHCLIGFQNDHCYTPLTSPSQTLPPRPSSASGYEDLETSIPCMPKSNIPSSKKITIIEQQIIPKGKTLLHINPSEARIILKGSDILRKPLPSLQNKVNKPSHIIQPENIPDISTVEERKIAITSVSPAREESESSSESINDRDSDSDYKDQKNPKVGKNKQVIKGVKKVFNKKFGKLKPNQLSASTKILKIGKIAKPKSLIKAEIKEKILKKKVRETQEKKTKILITKKRKKAMLVNEVPHLGETLKDAVQQPEPKQQETPKVQKAVPKKERKTPAHMTALLTDMTSLFSTPDVIRRVSTDAKTPVKIVEKTMTGSQNVKRLSDPKTPDLPKISELYKPLEVPISIENRSKSDGEKQPGIKDFARTSQIKEVKISIDKIPKVMDIPQLDDASLAQILQDTSSNVIPNVDNSLPMPSNVSSMPKEILPNQSNPLASPNSLNTNVLTGPLSPSLDLLGGLQPEEEGFTEDLLMHVAQLVESSENLQEVLDKQVLGKVSEPMLVQKIPPPIQQQTSIYQQSPTVGSMKNINTQYRKDPIQIVRSDGRVITLPPIEAPATRASKRKNQITSQDPHERPRIPEPIIPTAPPQAVSPVQQTPIVTKQYSNKRLSAKNEQVNLSQPAVASNVIAESDESWNSEDDPDRLWCICKQPHNNRFMICCDRCEDWFHGKCVNITKAMGQQMEEKGVEWTCPNCLKKKAQVEKPIAKEKAMRKSSELRKVEPYDNKNLSSIELPKGTPPSTNTNCIVCKKPARASSIYCSDSCILKHAQESLGVPPTSPTPAPAVIKQFTPRSQIKSKPESRVIVFERKTGRCLAGPSAPTAENLKEWLQENPTFEVVRPGTLNTNKKMVNVTKTPNKVTSQKIQTLLKFERQPKQAILLQPQPKPPPAETKTAKASQLTQSPTAPTPPRQQMKVQMPKSQPTEVKKIPAKVTPAKITPVKSVDRASPGLKSPTIPTALRIIPKDVERKGKMSGEPIRLNVKKALQEQISLRMAETSGPKFTSEDIKTFAVETELELHDLFKDVGTKYKAKYRSLMFNLKDRKNLSLWQKICDKALSPKQLVRLSPEELASQELAQWRDKEAKHQLELIKKSELDLLACAKTYVLKTHKGEEVMETKSSAPTELDPNVAVEDLVTALNDSTASVPTDVAEASASEKSSQHKHKHKSRTKRKSPSKDQRKDKSSDRVSVSNHKGTKESSSNKSHRRRGSKERVAKESSIVADNKKSKKSDKKSKEMELSKSKERQKEKKEKSHRSSLREQSKHSASSDSLKHISRDRSKHRSRSKSIESTKHASRSRDRSRHKSRSRDHSRYRSRSLSKSTDDSKRVSRSRDRSRHRSKSKDKSRRRSKSKHRSRSKQRSRTKYKSLSRERPQHRSLSQENYRSSSSTRSQSKDADPIERPKSATQKEVHPEYDPHEPMITSAFSEEDIAKSREDIYEDSYADDSFVNPGSKEYNVEYDPAKVYDSNIKTPPETPKLRWEKKTSSGTESDQEPSSTVDSTPLAVWNGCINMVDVARFYVTAHEVSGFCSDLEEDLNTELDIVGRINPDTVWDYIQKMKKAGNKDILVLRLTAANDEERMQYIALYSYLSSRNRLGVVKVTNTMTVKDFYIVPLSSHAPVPSVLQPLDGPGFDDIRSHLLVGVIVRQRKKKPAANPIETGPAKVAKLDVSGRKRSYTPPARSGDSYTPPTSPRSKPAAGAVSSSLPLPGSFSALSSSVKDKIAASLAAADDDEPYSPGDSDTSTTQDSSTAGDATAAIATDHLKLKMEELNRQIEEQKKQIMNMSANIPDEQDNEPYSPSRPMSPSASSKPQQTSIPTLSDISLPSNLQEILATIQKKSQPTVVVEEYNPSIVPPVNPTLAKADVDMRVLPPPLPAGPYSVPPPPFFINQTDKDIVPKPPSKLSTLSEAELLSMVPDDEIVVSKKRSSRFKSSIDASEPPPPGMEDEESL